MFYNLNALSIILQESFSTRYNSLNPTEFIWLIPNSGAYFKAISAQSAADIYKKEINLKKLKSNIYILTTNPTAVFRYTYLDACLYLFSNN